MLIMFQDDVVVKVKVINYYRDFFDERKISSVIIEVMIKPNCFPCFNHNEKRGMTKPGARPRRVKEHLPELLSSPADMIG